MMIKRKPDDPRLTAIRFRREMLLDGWNDRALAAARRTGDLAQPRRGVYVAGGPWSTLDDAGRHEVRCRAAVRAAGTEVAVSHTSGLTFYDTPSWGLAHDAVDLTRLDGRSGRAEAGIRQHRGKVAEGDVVHVGGVRVMHPTRAALEATTQLGVEAALVQICHLLHRGLTTREDLQARYTSSMERWPGSLRTELCLQLARAEIESVGEARTWHLFHRHGIPLPVPQYPVRDRHGRIVARLDFAWPDLGCFLEFDGRVKYQQLLREGETVTDVVLREKERESLVCRLTGWRCLRLVWEDLAHPERTARMILDALFGSVAA
jgi:hypothetical protein